MSIHLHHIGMSVADVERTIEALVEGLGAERLPAPSAGHALIRVGNLHLALVSAQAKDPLTRAWGDHLAFTMSASAREETVRRLSDRGWKVEAVQGRIYAQSSDGLLLLELLLAQA